MRVSSLRGKSFRSTDAIRLTDGPTRELIFRVIQYIERNILLSFGFEFLEAEFSNSGMQTIPHNLGFMPKDIIQTSLTGTGSITFNYDSFTDKAVIATTTGPCKVRFLVGTHRSE